MREKSILYAFVNPPRGFPSPYYARNRLEAWRAFRRENPFLPKVAVYEAGIPILAVEALQAHLITRGLCREEEARDLARHIRRNCKLSEIVEFLNTGRPGPCLREAMRSWKALRERGEKRGT